MGQSDVSPSDFQLKGSKLTGQILIFAESSGLQNVVDGQAVGIAITGMLIVFSALVLITIFITALPKILDLLDPYLPAVEHPHAAPTPAESLPSDEEKIVAAIGFVLHHEMQRASR